MSERSKAPGTSQNALPDVDEAYDMPYLPGGQNARPASLAVDLLGLANHVEMKPFAVAHDLTGSASEFAGSADEVEPVIPAPDVAVDPQRARTADLAVEVDRRSALELVAATLATPDLIVTDLVVAIEGREQLLGEVERVAGAMR